MRPSRSLLVAQFAVAAALLSGSAAAQTTAPEPAAALIAAARREASRTGRNVLVEFGASWCGWCKRFEAFLADPDVGRVMHDHYVVVHLVVHESGDKAALNNPGSDTVLNRMGGGRTGIPFFFVLDPAGRKLGDSNCLPNGDNVGHPYTPAEVKAFIGFLEKTAPRMTKAERDRIRAYLERVAGR